MNGDVNGESMYLVNLCRFTVEGRTPKPFIR